MTVDVSPRRWWLPWSSALLSAVIGLWPAAALADGGPIVEPSLYARLKEGQQVAVVTIKDLQTVSVELFVSILDETGVSHEITYFVPLGVDAGGLSVGETDSVTFSRSYTNEFDTRIFEYREQSRQFTETLFAGALLANGAWLAPVWIPVFLTGCDAGSALAPVSSFTTESSEVSVFDVSEDTDVDALAATAGLDPSVAEALSRVRGQQIAVVKLHTAPLSAGGDPGGGAAEIGEPGLHLSWHSALVTAKAGPTYAYPLSTGAAWASPIEMTRVYVVAPPDLHFNVRYPKLGIRRPGMTVEGGRYVPLIAQTGKAPAYAAESAFNQKTTSGSGHPFLPNELTVWRGTYANSNAAEDIVITVKSGAAVSALGARVRSAGQMRVLISGLIAAAVFWILAWWFLMPRLLGGGVKAAGVLGLGLGFLGWNLLLFLPGAVAFLISTMGAGHRLEPLVVTVPLFALAGALMTGRLQRRTEVSLWTAVKSVAAVTLVSGGAYILFVFGFAGLAGAM